MNMEFQAELVSRFMGALGKPCAWIPWTPSLPDAPIGEWVDGPNGACYLRVREDLGVDGTSLAQRERAFLTWALRSSRGQRDDKPMVRLRNCPARHLVDAVAGLACAEPVREAAASVPLSAYPAHLVAIEWSARVGRAPEPRESADMVKRVTEAYVEASAWQFFASMPLAIASVSRSALCHAWLSLGHAEMDVRGISALAAQIASALRSEAMIDARVAISGVIRTPQDAPAGVAMLELARREALQRATGAAVFGDDPVRMALRWLDDTAKAAFLRSVSAISEEETAHWPEGWGEMASAMVHANLNLSEAARSLYMHRNTLLARIEKLREASGLDVRRGTDAFALFAATALLEGQSALE
ncbi:helix-turn-helix domain-containing protein [Alicyclobacillus sendaiensis]|uniref:helix-turn-helix domain-containing protein n=2 Tax=Alicyclobacillus sendaiensis TaxID=192387 RepID=UPI0026F42949|nr:helix-turn-helix domain-containing protein [Alicyclobacillus sendaiensis]